MDENKTRGHWFRFGLGHLFVLILGVAIGFTPFKVWEIGAPPEAPLIVTLQVFELPPQELAVLHGNRPDQEARQLVMDADGSLSRQLDALRQDGRATLLSEPKLVTMNGRRGSIMVGGQVAIVRSTESGSSTVGYKDVGMRVDVTPTLLRNGRVRLEISSEINNVDTSRPVTVDGVTYPTLRTRAVEGAFESDLGSTVVFTGYGDTAPRDASVKDVVVIATVERMVR